MIKLILPCGEYRAHLDADNNGLYGLSHIGDEFITFIHTKRSNWATKLYNKYQDEIDRQVKEGLTWTN